MSDPRLCSVHLEALPRRQEYRRAREALLGACGSQTLAACKDEQGNWVVNSPNTLIQNEPGKAPRAHKYMLMDKEFTYPLHVGLNTVGRLTDNDVVVDDASVSRRHCAIVVHVNNGCEVHDTASKNGTFVNGRRITGPTRLAPGDEIRMCNRQLIFVTHDEDSSQVKGPDHTITRAH
jgi:pSer/pThr/pTyr-binding forkhead associated (FHA) protein